MKKIYIKHGSIQLLVITDSRHIESLHIITFLIYLGGKNFKIPLLKEVVPLLKEVIINFIVQQLL